MLTASTLRRTSVAGSNSGIGSISTSWRRRVVSRLSRRHKCQKLCYRRITQHHSLFTTASHAPDIGKPHSRGSLPAYSTVGGVLLVVTGSLFILFSQLSDSNLRELSCEGSRNAEEKNVQQQRKKGGGGRQENIVTRKLPKLVNDEYSPRQLPAEPAAKNEDLSSQQDTSNTVSVTWANITSALTNLAATAPNISLSSILPDWALALPMYFQKLKAEFAMAPGSLAYEIWEESFSPYVNPEISWEARARLSPKLCDEELRFISRRRKYIKAALADYLLISLEEINEADIPTIAITASGGGLRAMVSSTGSFWATKAVGLFDCTTYTAGVSGSCWMQAVYFSSLTNTSFPRLVDHLKSRLKVHLAYPPAALNLLDSAPTNRYLLRGIIERARRGYNSFSLVDIYGVLLAGRLLIPSNELAVNDEDLKLSMQRRFLEMGENPMPIYTCVRHEIPGLKEGDKVNEPEKLKVALGKDWFQWFEITPYELYCEDAEAGIPTWAMGRRFYRGVNVDREVPELKLPLLLGIFGSAFCATLIHYYNEIRPFVAGIGWGLQKVDSLISEKKEDLVKVHPVNPACIPNYLKGLGGALPPTCPDSLHDADNLQLMDAGMSNNLACYPLLRHGRDVDILIAFDASAEIQTANWIGYTEGYTKQKEIKGWPVSIGWPKPTDVYPEEQLGKAQALSAEDAQGKFKEAQAADMQNPNGLGYCTVWVGTKEERSSEEEPSPSKAVEEDWELLRPDAGITVVYFPLIPNPQVPGVDPQNSSFLSTWNFEWTPEQVDATVALARANFREGEDKVKRIVRAVYERKKRRRLEKEREALEALEKDIERRHQEDEARHGHNERMFGSGFH